MAEVYDHVPGIPGRSGPIPNASKAGSKANQLERVIALHEDVRERLEREGKAIAQRAAFRLSAAQQRHLMQLREQVADAVESGDPERVQEAARNSDRYQSNKTRVFTAHADVDFHIGFTRADGREFFVEADSREGDRGLEILQKSLEG